VTASPVERGRGDRFGSHYQEISPCGIRPRFAFLIVTVRDRFDNFVAAVGEPARQLTLPEPTPPDGSRVSHVAASYNIEILPPPA